MGRNKNDTYQCVRCGYSESKTSSLNKHMDRKRPCKALLADVPARLEVVVTGTGSAGAAMQVMGNNNTTSTSQNVNNNQTVTNNIQSDNVTVNNTTTHHHHHHHNHIHVHPQLVPMEETDLSHIPEDVWREIVRIASQDAAGAMRLYVRMVHFNPVAPSNMNFYVPSEPGANAAVYECVNGQKVWSSIPTEQAHDSLIATRAADILAKMDDSSRRSFEQTTGQESSSRTRILAVVKNVTADGSTDVLLMHRDRLPLQSRAQPQSQSQPHGHSQASSPASKGAEKNATTVAVPAPLAPANAVTTTTTTNTASTATTAATIATTSPCTDSTHNSNNTDTDSEADTDSDDDIDTHGYDLPAVVKRYILRS